MPRETEFVLAKELDGPQSRRWEGTDELPHGKGKITKILNDSGVLTIYAENGMIVRDMHAPVERYVR